MSQTLGSLETASKLEDRLSGGHSNREQRAAASRRRESQFFLAPEGAETSANWRSGGGIESAALQSLTEEESTRRASASLRSAVRHGLSMRGVDRAAFAREYVSLHPSASRQEVMDAYARAQKVTSEQWHALKQERRGDPRVNVRQANAAPQMRHKPIPGAPKVAPSVLAWQRRATDNGGFLKHGPPKPKPPFVAPLPPPSHHVPGHIGDHQLSCRLIEYKEKHWIDASQLPLEPLYKFPPPDVLEPRKKRTAAELREHEHYETPRLEHLDSSLVAKYKAALQGANQDNKLQRVVMNGAAYVLSGPGARNFSKVLRADLRAKAEVMRISLAYKPPVPRVSTLWDFLPTTFCEEVRYIHTSLGPVQSYSEMYRQVQNLEKDKRFKPALLEAIARAIADPSAPLALPNIEAVLTERKPKYRLAPPAGDVVHYQGGPVWAKNVTLLASITKMLLPVEETGFGKHMTTLSLAMLSIVDSSSWQGVCAALLQALRIAAPEAITFFAEFLSCGVVEFQGTEPTWNETLRGVFNTGADAFTSSSVGSAIGSVLSTFSIVGILGASGLCGSQDEWKARVAILSSLLLSDRPNPLETLIQRLLRFFGILVARVIDAVRTRNMAALFGARMTFGEWSQWTGHLLNSQEIWINAARPDNLALFNRNLQSGVYGNTILHQLAHEDQVPELKRAIDEVGALQAAYSGSPLVMAEVVATTKLLKAAKNQAEARLLSANARVPPFALFIPGPPGIGKSTFIDVIFQFLGRRLQRGISADAKFIIQPGLNFPVYNPAQWFGIADDIDSNPTPPSPGTRENHVELVLAMVNSTPYNMEGAGIPDKGTQWLALSFLAYSTNNKGGNLTGRTMCPMAFWRRFPYQVLLVPDEKYCRPSSGTERMIDPAKVPANGSQDVWSEIRVERFSPSPTASGETIYVPHLVFDNLQAFCEWLLVAVKEHEERLAKGVGVRDMCECGLAVVSHRAPCAFSLSQAALEIDVQSPDPSPRVSVSEPLEEKDDLVEPVVETSLVVHSSPLVISPPEPSLEDDPAVEFQCGALRVRRPRFCANAFHFLLSFAMKVFLMLWFPLTVIDFTAIWWTVTTYWVGFSVGMAQAEVLRLTKTWVDRFGHLPALLATGAALAVAVQGVSWASTKLIYQSGEVPEHVPTQQPNLQKSTASWRRVEMVTSRPHFDQKAVSTTPKELVDSFRKSMVKVSYRSNGMHAVALGRGCFLTAWHLLGPPNGALTNPAFGTKMKIDYLNTTIEVLLEESMVQQVQDLDLVVIHIPELMMVPGALRRFPAESVAVPLFTADKAFFFNLEDLRPMTYLKTTNARASKMRPAPWWVCDAPTEGGDCGGLYLATFGNNHVVVGVHVALANGEAFGENVNQASLSLAMQRLSEKSIAGLVEVEYQAAGILLRDFDLVPTPAKSSLAVALSASDPPPFVSGGTIKDFHAYSFKSKAREMRFREVFQPLEQHFLGASPVFAIPSSVGRVVDDVWVDPFTVNMGAAVNRGGEWSVWRLSVDDYLSGVETLPGRDRVAPLSMYEAVIGIPDTDAGGIDMNTSAGPPFYRAKSFYVKIDHTAREVSIHPDLQAEFDRIDREIQADVAVAAVCNYVLKDEMISVAKAEACRVRVFNVLSFAFNTRLKQYLLPLLIFMRSHPYFFETAIGMDVRCLTWTTLYQWLSAHDNWIAADNAHFDVKMSTREGLATVSCLMRLAQVCGYTTEDLRVLNLLLHSCIFTTRVCKGDLFYTSFMMCTGFWATILFNTVRNCLQSRYCFYQVRPTPSTLLFRDGVRLMTLGDDRVATTCWDWYNQLVLRAVSLEFGAVVTSASKSAVLAPFEVKSEVTFLKRRFAFLPNHSPPLLVAPIEIKTLVKMVRFALRGSMSEVDHHCQLYSNVLAEAWMHGPEVFEIFDEKISRVVGEARWASIYYRRFPFSEYVTRYSENVLSVWDPSSNVE